MSKTLTEMLIDLRLDLKDSGALWEDAELTRSIKRAVADLSRFLPLEKSHEVTIDTEVDNESFLPTRTCRFKAWLIGLTAYIYRLPGAETDGEPAPSESY